MSPEKPARRRVVGRGVPRPRPHIDTPPSRA
jgi:hypothetical protein